MKKLIIVIIFLIPLLIVGGFWIAGSFLTAPVQAQVGNCPADLTCENIEFPSESGSMTKGWLLPGEPGKGAVILMHGLRANRLTLIDRMRFLHQSGYSVLAFDFQASGESQGKQLTFGYLESRDATASIKFLHEKLPGEKIGVLGISMGGASFLLQKDPQKVDALILEMVYPSIQQAIEDRLNLWLFPGAAVAAPLMTFQFPLRLGISADEMRPIDKIAGLATPKLFIAGEKDPRTRLEESQQFFKAAGEPKELWVIQNAGHIDFYTFSPKDYEEKVLGFFNRNLRNQPTN